MHGAERVKINNGTIPQVLRHYKIITLFMKINSSIKKLIDS